MSLDPTTLQLSRARRQHPRRRGQAIVEFGLVALMFTLLLFGVVDLGILLNGWLGVSSSARDVARQLAVGICPSTATVAPCVGGGGGVPSVPAASALSIQGVDRLATTPVAVTVKVCSAGDPTNCWPISTVSNIYAPNGTCTTACAHPASNDSIVVTVAAQIQVITPLVRPFFGCINGAVRCDVRISSQAVVRYEGQYL
ncbi:MAG: pilus assembly protein [Chloroflexi bacterium]|nr:pilus assembly protein [Chloroflexota bacterium]